MRPVERLLATARAEIGYIEKDTNAQLDDKTANAGDGNWNKYARDLDALGVVYNGKKNGYAWCDIFTDWCFIQTFGLELGRSCSVRLRKVWEPGVQAPPTTTSRRASFTPAAHSPATRSSSQMTAARPCIIPAS